jgi:hypothetical protein
MALPASGQISLSQVNTELGLSSTALIGMGDAAVRTLFGVASGQITMSDGYGKSNEFAFSISSNQTNADISTLATNAGWNGSSKLVATIDSGIYISSNSTGTPALTISGSFPGGVDLINNGIIVGMGGNGGTGGGATYPGTFVGVGGSGGSSGGLALSVSSAVSITNNDTIAGGGGGGGGGAAAHDGNAYMYGAGGGGGGRSSNAANSSGGSGGPASGGVIQTIAGSSGGSGNVSSAGGGGTGGGAHGGFKAGNGGSGGGWGASGGSGGSAAGNLISGPGPYGGGSSGGAISGNSNITWVAFGTRLGGIS